MVAKLERKVWDKEIENDFKEGGKGISITDSEDSGEHEEPDAGNPLVRICGGGGAG
jgi:hypothetical protein